MTLLGEGIVTLFLYHAILGRGDPVAEQLTRIASSVLDTLTKAWGTEVNTGSSEERYSEENWS